MQDDNNPAYYKAYTILNTINYPCYELDREGIFVFVNKKAEEIFKMRKEDMLGKNVWEVFPHSLNTPSYAAINNALHKKEAAQYEYISELLKSWVLVNIIPIETGAIISLTKIETLRQSKENLQKILDAMPQLVWTTTPMGDVDFFNEQVFNYTRLTYDELKAWGWSSIAHTDDLAVNMPIIMNGIQTGTALSYAIRLKRYDGVYRWHLNKAIPLRNEHGEVYMWVGSSTDIDDEKKNRDLLQSVFDASSNTISFMKNIRNEEGAIIDFELNTINEKARIVSGADSQGKRYSEVFTVASGIKEKFIDTAVTGNPLQFETCYPIDGIDNWYDVRAVKMDDGVLITSENITERKKAEATTALVIEALHEQNRKLTESRELIKRKDEFISIASHELKTPITSIKGYVGMMMEKYRESDDPFLSKSIFTVNKQLIKLTDLINNLLDVTRIDIKRMEFNMHPFDICATVAEAVAIMQPTIAHTLLVEGPSSCDAYGDKDRITQVISNLLTNAIKYSPSADKVLINISNTPTAITVTVKDFGIGIDPEYQQRIFERFYRVEGEVEKNFAGFGIGLYISAEIINRHKGKIGVESKKGEGSTFYFSIPTETII
ncbi:MAG TPA: PAS domain-containing sensor histidine kinase [Ferruginibacter sp.]|nr:PAS domain-containing sensor histidine kinase [Ferruginibacter sp.]